MIKLAITGGIGSGKSVVARLLGLMGVPVYLTDNEAKRLNVESPVIRRQLMALVGNAVYTSDGSLNKALLAEYMFSDARHVMAVNSIVHPVVKTDFLRWIEVHRDCPLVAMECAILYEAGFDTLVDEVAIVSAPLELRVARAMQRDGVSEDKIRQRIVHQLADETLQACRAHLLLNDERTPLIPQVLRLIEELTEKSRP